MIKFDKLIKVFGIITEYEAYINAFDEGYDAEDAIFSGYFCEIYTPQVNLVKRSQYGNGCDFKHEIIEHRDNNCFIPTKGYCFVKGNNYLTGEVYKQQYLDFIRNEKKRSKIMTMARIQPCMGKLVVNLGYYKGKEVWPRSITE